jgi:hypothetical protein
MADLNSIKGVEIFAAGVWNGDRYEVADLDQMIIAFEETSRVFKPFLKLGHDEGQKIIQKDGLPAAGWIDKVYRIGDKLLADFADIPSKIYDLIKNKAYRKVSSEIYWNMEVLDKKYPYLLGAVSLLGADTPAVTCLNDILAFYGLEKQNEVTFKQYLFNGEEKPVSKTEGEIKAELELADTLKKVEESEAQAKTYAQERDSLKTELEAVKAEKAKLEAKAQELAFEAVKAQREKYMTELMAEKLITPAMKSYVAELICEEKKEYSVGEKKLSMQDLLKEILKLHTASDVNTTEGSEDGRETQAIDSDESINQKIEKYMADNSVSYKAAYKAVTAEIKPRASVAIQKVAAVDN